jgi:small subunit ribosomal protein S4
MVIQSLESQERDIPDSIDFDQTKFMISMKKIPNLDDVPYAVQMEPNLVIEFYSR